MKSSWAAWLIVFGLHLPAAAADAPPPDVSEEEAAQASPAVPAWALPEPDPLPREDRRASAPAPVFYRAPKLRSAPPTLRVAPGSAIALTGERAGRWSFALDAVLSAWAEVDRTPSPRVVLLPELGYSLGVSADGQEHLGLLGIGPGLRFEHLTVQLVPRLLLGVERGDLAVGVRTGLGLHLGSAATLGLELAHRWLRAGGRQGHGLELVLSLDLLGYLFWLDEEVRW